VARLEQIRSGSGSPFTVADKNVALFNADATICAMDDTCLTPAARWDWESSTAPR
jgi:Tfp pilus assembly protein PilV